MSKFPFLCICANTEAYHADVIDAFGIFLVLFLKALRDVCLMALMLGIRQVSGCL